MCLTTFLFCLSIEGRVSVWPLWVCNQRPQGTENSLSFTNGSEMRLATRKVGDSFSSWHSLYFCVHDLFKVFIDYIKWSVLHCQSLLSSRRSNFKYHCPCYSNLDRDNYQRNPLHTAFHMGPILLIGSRDDAKLYDASYHITHQSFYGIDMGSC